MIEISLYKAGSCSCSRYMLTGSFSLKADELPMVCGLIRHPELGYILFDTGYSENFFKCTDKFPYSLCKTIVSVHLPKTLKELLSEDGISPDEIKYIIISHFHFDHICAVDDFPNATIICSQKGYDYSKSGGFKGHKAIFPDLIKMFRDRKLIFFESMSDRLVGDDLSIGVGYDVFKDRSVVAYPLPGHAVGHYGILCKTSNRGSVFLIADAAWTIGAIEGIHHQHWLTHLLLDNKKEYYSTLDKLKILQNSASDIKLVPSHCSLTYQKWIRHEI